MKPQILLFMFLFFLILKPILTVGYPDPSSTDDSDFVRASCNITLYPDICYYSLSPYAGSVQADSSRLARLAIHVSLNRTRTVSAYVANISTDDNTTAAIIHDCFSNLKDAVGSIRDSLKQMRQLVSWTGGSAESFKFQISNVQTWMSAALTDEETCTDGFDQVADETEVKAEVCDKVAEAKKLTSNALALVNSLE